MAVRTRHFFETNSHELIVDVGTKIKVNFLRGLEVPDSDRGMETIIFG
jgi:hypothetical protein